MANTTGSIISHTTIISIAYLASPDSSGSLGIIIYSFRRKYPVSKAAKGLRSVFLSTNVRYNRNFRQLSALDSRLC